jgi:dienelactone hydrolase
MKKFTTVIMGALVLALAAGCASGGKASEQFTAKTLSIPGTRQNAIPAILTIPRGSPDEKYPVVLLAHGHGGSKSESGGFDLLARVLAEKGIASLRMDFPGCGDSTEDFSVANRLTYMIDDVNACKAYLESVPEVDTSRLGLLGYSMGGRIAAVMAGRDPAFKSVVLWSPAALPGTGDLYVFMQLDGEAGFNQLYAEAKANGAATYTNAFGAVQTLALGWFDDMVQINPQQEFASFQGSLLLITASEDVIIPPENARRITTVAPGAQIRQLEVQGADHGYGIYSGETHLTELAAQSSADFFVETL